MQFSLTLGLVIAGTLLLAPSSNAQSGGVLQIDRFTVAGGGGSANGGAFQINGSIAQLDADPLQPSSGGSFSLTGGFWVVDAQTASDLIFRDGLEQP